MAIDSTYRNILTETFLIDELKKGEIPSAEDITDKINTFLADLDLTKPLFVADDFKATEEGQSSASKFNQFQLDVLRDLRALYKDMLTLTEVSTGAYERWSLESDTLEKRLEELEDRIQNLLLLTKDTEGYHSYLVDNFTDLALVDRDLTTAAVDPSTHLVTLGPSDTTVDTRVYLNSIDPTDISFKVRSTVDLISRNDGPGQSLANIFRQQSSTWWTLVSMRKSSPVTAELLVKLADDPVAISKIVMKLHDSSRSSPMSITPLYSVDNFNFVQLPTNTYTQSVRALATFQFKEIEAKWIKFVLTKTGPDPISNSSKAVFQFGFKEIAFFAEGFSSEDSQVIISTPLSIPRAANPNELVEFSKLTLEVCERVETGTEINYFVTASDNSSVPVTDSTVWVPITPISRATSSQSKVIDLGDIETIERGLEQTVTISHDALAEDETLVNPAASFQLLSQDTDGDILDETVVATEPRYIFTNPSDRILNYQIKDSDYDGSGTGNAVTIDEDSIVIFRNVGAQGLDPDDDTSEVRDVQRGWKFQEPYYTTVVEIQKPEGITIDFGDKPIIIDDIKYTNVVGPTVLTGKTPSSRGIHVIKVHKDNWLAIEPDIETLEDLQAADSLYPHNHKLLIEGYAYPDTYSNNQEKVYKGVDLFASELMKRISIFDLAHSAGTDRWNFFALDRDAPDTHTGDNESTRVFVVKVDEQNTDFANERFVVRFNLVNQRYKYLRFKAELSTTSDTVSPALDSYKIKLGG
jgi:hypothetical protein